MLNYSHLDKDSHLTCALVNNYNHLKTDRIDMCFGRIWENCKNCKNLMGKYNCRSYKTYSIFLKITNRITAKPNVVVNTVLIWSWLVIIDGPGRINIAHTFEFDVISFNGCSPRDVCRSFLN